LNSKRTPKGRWSYSRPSLSPKPGRLLPGCYPKPKDARSRCGARCRDGHPYEAEAREARDWAAVRGFMAEQRGAIGIVLRYSGAAEPEEPSVEASALVRAELEAATRQA
jgi:hypothetical protein